MGAAFCESLRRRNDGFTLLETLVAMAIVLTFVLSVGQLLLTVAAANHMSRRSTIAVTLASQKLEQLLSLEWCYNAQGAPATDMASSLATGLPPQSGGRGLLPSPPSALAENVSGYVDYADLRGGWLGAGPTVPPNAAYIRRWSIVPLPANQEEAIVLQVLVTGPSIRAGQVASGPTVLAGDVLVTTVKSRKAQ
jgi:prepilin-type N-terminal cleavage/methylation domain-containing protein